MKNIIRSIILLSLIASMASFSSSKKEGKHLFILSGQSNMARLNPDKTFVPTIKEKLGSDNFIVVKDALGGQSIKRWYKKWSFPGVIENQIRGDLYQKLMTKVYSAIENETIASVTFIWMQGERDANAKYGEVYEESLIGLYNQLSDDLNRNDVNFVIGRISDFDMRNSKYKHWTMIRDIQVKVGESDPRFDWINTDDLNDVLKNGSKEIRNDLHMSQEGYLIMGKRFANKAINLLEL